MRNWLNKHKVMKIYLKLLVFNINICFWRFYALSIWNNIVRSDIPDQRFFGYFGQERYQRYHLIDTHPLIATSVETLSVFTLGQLKLCSERQIYFGTHPNILKKLRLVKYQDNLRDLIEYARVFKNVYPPKFRDENCSEIHPYFFQDSNNIFLDTILEKKNSVAKI